MKKIIALALVLTPATAFAATAVTDVNSLTSKLTGIGNTLIGILIAVAVIYIIWHTVKFIMAGDSDKRKEIQGSIIWGIVGLAIILCIWGLVAILTNTFNTQNTEPVSNFPVNPNPSTVQ